MSLRLLGDLRLNLGRKGAVHLPGYELEPRALKAEARATRC
jgi:hypothetical protein